MKKGTFWLVITLLMVASMILASCGTSTTTSTTTAKTTTQTNTVIPSSTTSATTTTKVSTTTPTSTTGANWWDKLGNPQYGGTIIYSSGFDFTNHDPYSSMGGASMETAWMDKLASDDWTVDPAVFNFRIAWRPPQYVGGQLAKSWEFTDASTLVFHLRQGVHYQNIDPVNGRELTSADIVYHYQRLYGLGSSMKGAPALTTSPMAQTLSTITANDKYTVTMVWKSTNPEYITETWQAAGGEHCIEAKEAVDKWGDLTDWHHAVGTGPFIMKDLVSGASVTLSKNPNYWAVDERYPQNQLPYADTLKILIIADSATQMAALRTGKIDAIDNVSTQNANSILKSNPEIQQTLVPYSCLTIDPRYDKAPYNDVRVRKAMQMAIDLPTIAATYYFGNSPSTPSSLTSMYETGWDLPYAQWPQALKDEYTYNPKAAKQLLTDAGFPNGIDVKITALVGQEDACTALKQYWDAAGIRTTIDMADPGRFYGGLYGAGWDDLLLTSYGEGDMLANFQNNLGDQPLTHMAAASYAIPPALLAMSKDSRTKKTKAEQDAAMVAITKWMADNDFIIPLWLVPGSFVRQAWLHCDYLQQGGFSFYFSHYWMEKH